MENNLQLSFAAWFELNKHDLPEPLKKIVSNHYETLRFICDDFMKGTKIMKEALHELIREQYPVFKTETRPLVLDKINTIVETASYYLVVETYNIIQQQNEGIDFRKEYPELEEWKETYGKPEPLPNLLTDEDREEHWFLSDEEWEERKEEENTGMMQFYHWQTRRKFEFNALALKVLFPLYSGCVSLDPDPLILFAVNLEEVYLGYRLSAENTERIIDYGFPEEVVTYKYTDYLKMTEELPREQRDYVGNLRSRRIAGEKI